MIMSTFRKRLSHLTAADARHDREVDVLLGKSLPGEPYPWLTERQEYHRKWFELPLCEDIAVSQVADIDNFDVDRTISQLCDEAHLTTEERGCFLKSQTMSTAEIAVAMSLGPKTVLRRVKSALIKVAQIVSQLNPD